jgi:quinol-cytochrome oxidoreductase complex cytochrome b subunit
MAICWVTRFVESDLYFNGVLLPWLGLGYATLFATLYAYNAYSWAGKRVSPAITTVYNTLQPVGTSLLSVFFLHHHIILPEILGGLLVMLGLIITVYGRQQELAKIPKHGSDSDSPLTDEGILSTGLLGQENRSSYSALTVKEMDESQEGRAV